MPSRTNRSTDSDSDGFVVKASDVFRCRRLITIQGLDKKQFRLLRRGEEVKISKVAYNADKTLYIKVKE